MTATITGQTLIDWGFKPASWFKDAIPALDQAASQGETPEHLRELAQSFAPAPIETIGLRTNNIPFSVFLDPETEAERGNLAAVIEHMDALMRVPTIKAGVVMPDACPAGSALGTIPVGGVVAAEDAIHPGFHSADICCSMAISVFKRSADPKQLLDAVFASTHFGPGGRPGERMLQTPPVVSKFKDNAFLRDLTNYGIGHFGSQGDGNHFAYVGRRRSDGKLALVTHHGSRGLGAQLYKRGMAAAQKHTAIYAPKVPRHNAWIKASSDQGQAYWEALQIVREWTRESHFAIHDLAARTCGNAVIDRWWNEHNFVFRKPDGLYYHAKGATPSFDGFSADDDGRTLIPLNMSEPILIAMHKNNPKALEFAPHGAGRNLSRTQHLRTQSETGLVDELAALQGRGLDIRSYCGVPDHSELPSAYKNAEAVQAQINKYGLADIVDYIDPYGSIMAGDWEKDAPWRKR